MKYYRTRVIIDEIKNSLCKIIIPGWNSKVTIEVPIGHFPFAMRKKLSPNSRIYARATLKAETKEEMKIRDWEYRGEISENRLDEILKNQRKIIEDKLAKQKGENQ